MTHLRPAFVLIILFTVLTGIVLPLGFTGAATAVVPYQANGSLLYRNGQMIGSALLGQDFESAKYFHPRPSATSAPDPKDSTKTISLAYNAANSSGSNLGPSSQALHDRVKTDAAALGGKDIPSDMVTTSASGLDPDITPQNAMLQVARVAAARHMDPDKLRDLVQANIKDRLFGIFGEPRVNVLALNLALDVASAP
jgi:K+-transporting ATPase ATPase C chain